MFTVLTISNMNISLNIPGHCAGSYAREKYILSLSCYFQNLFIFVLQSRGDATGCGKSRKWISQHNCSRYTSAAFCFLSLTISAASVGRFSCSDFSLCNLLSIISLQTGFCRQIFLQERYHELYNHFNFTFILNAKCSFI